MLFSNEKVAEYINAAFEPVWESVRPVPIIRIDFGNGNVLTRTLHGNIATYVCTADGQVLDILPGIYEPHAYLDQLEQLAVLAKLPKPNFRPVFPGVAAGTGLPVKLSVEDLQARLTKYHRAQAEALKKNEPAWRLVFGIEAVSKTVMERPFKILLSKGEPPPTGEKPREELRLPDAGDLAHWRALAEDTRVNETVRRLQIQEKLSADGAVRPETVTKWLYKEVLHADLDDPYLGLGKVLFASYPFTDEDKP